MAYRRQMWENDKRSLPFAKAFESYYTDWILAGYQWSAVGMEATAPGNDYTKAYNPDWGATVDKVDRDYENILQAEKDVQDPDVDWTTLVQYLMWMIPDTQKDVEAAKKVGHIIDPEDKFLKFSERHLARTVELLKKYRDKV